MKKQLSFIGGSWRLILNKALLQLLRFSPEKVQLLCTFKNNSLYLTKTNDDELKKIENPLVKKLIKQGNGYVISITKPILELLNINPEVDYINIDIQDNVLIIKKAD